MVPAGARRHPHNDRACRLPYIDCGRGSWAVEDESSRFHRNMGSVSGRPRRRSQARRAAETEANRRGEPLATGSSLCVPYGVPSMMSVAVYPVEFIQTPKQITAIAEALSEVRRIYLDRPQAKIDEVPPGYYGRSVGRWEGDTLVVDTVGIKESVQYQRIPHSDQMRITERIRFVAPDVLHDQITIEDPVTLEKPFTYTLAYRRMPNYEMVEFVCDNNREYVDEQGVVRLKV